jgi:hypothetical protein
MRTLAFVFKRRLAAVHLAFIAVVVLHCGGDLAGNPNASGGGAGSGSSAAGAGGRGGATATGAGGSSGAAQAGAGGDSVRDGGAVDVVVDAVEAGRRDASIDVSTIDVRTIDVRTIDARRDVTPTIDVATIDAPTVDASNSSCHDLLALDPTGLYYASCRPRDLPIPVAFAISLKINSSPDAATATIDLAITSLKAGATTMSDTSGSTTVVPQATLGADCTYTARPGALTIPADANSLMRDLVVEDAVLRGKLQTNARSCSELDGMVSLIMLSLQGDGDVCVLIRTNATDPPPFVSDSDYVCDPSTLPPR